MGRATRGRTNASLALPLQFVLVPMTGLKKCSAAYLLSLFIGGIHALVVSCAHCFIAFFSHTPSFPCYWKAWSSLVHMEHWLYADEASLAFFASLTSTLLVLGAQGWCSPCRDIVVLIVDLHFVPACHPDIQLPRLRVIHRGHAASLGFYHSGFIERCCRDLDCMSSVSLDIHCQHRVP